MILIWIVLILEKNLKTENSKSDTSRNKTQTHTPSDIAKTFKNTKDI